LVTIIELKAIDIGWGGESVVSNSRDYRIPRSTTAAGSTERNQDVRTDMRLGQAGRTEALGDLAVVEVAL
jgi:hypothetical protein